MNPFSITYNNLTIDRNQSTYTITSWEGLDGLPIRISEADTTGFDGGNIYSRRYTMRTIVLEGTILTETAAEYFLAKEALVEAYSRFATNNLMTITKWDGTTKYIQAKVVSPPMVVERGGSNVTNCRFRLEVKCEDPFFYANESTTTVYLSSGTGVPIPAPIPLMIGAGSDNFTTVFNTGDVVSYPEFKIYGEVTTPSIINTATGQSFLIDNTIAGSDYVKVKFDTQGMYVFLNDSVNYYQYYEGDIIQLALGTNVFRYTAAVYSESSYVEITTRDYYLSI